MSDHMKLFRAVGREIEWRERAEKAEAEIDRLKARHSDSVHAIQEHYRKQHQRYPEGAAMNEINHWRMAARKAEAEVERLTAENRRLRKGGDDE